MHNGQKGKNGARGVKNWYFVWGGKMSVWGLGEAIYGFYCRPLSGYTYFG
jgi:hypothetical protein